jgi:hypothetical protein
LAIAHLPVSVEMDCAKLVPETGPFPRLVRSTEPAGLRFRKKNRALSQFPKAKKFTIAKPSFLSGHAHPSYFQKGRHNSKRFPRIAFFFTSNAASLSNFFFECHS